MHNVERLVAVAAQAGYGAVTEEWCDLFLRAARTDGRERSVKDSFRRQYDNLNRGGEKRFVCYRRILIVYEGKRAIDFRALIEVHSQILRSPDRSPTGRDRTDALFAVAVSIQLHRKACKRDRIPDAVINPEA